MISCLLSQSLPGAKLTFLDGIEIPGGCEVSLDLVTENWTQPLEVPRGLLALLVTNTGARAKDVLPDVSITGDAMSPQHAGSVGVGVEGQAPVFEYRPTLHPGTYQADGIVHLC